MLNIAVLVSGGGTNLQAIIDAIREGTIHDARIGLVLSNNHGVYALERAKKAGIPSCVLSPREFESREAFNRALLKRVQESGADLVVLAGFLCVIPPEMVHAYENRILNIHPSLIPSFCGKGFYGLKVHEEALKRGVRITGATVHFVNEIPDGGKILIQKPVEVKETDTPEILQKRVMEEAEWIILPEAVRMVSERLEKEKR